MRMWLIAAGAAALALAGCGNDDNLRERMVQCSGFIGGVGDTEMGGPIMETLGYNRIGSIGQTGGLYYQQMEPARAEAARSEGRNEAHRLGQRNDVRGAIEYLEGCERVRDRLAR